MQPEAPPDGTEVGAGVAAFPVVDGAFDTRPVVDLEEVTSRPVVAAAAAPVVDLEVVNTADVSFLAVVAAGAGVGAAVGAGVGATVGVGAEEPVTVISAQVEKSSELAC